MHGVRLLLELFNIILPLFLNICRDQYQMISSHIDENIFESV